VRRARGAAGERPIWPLGAIFLKIHKIVQQKTGGVEAEACGDGEQQNRVETGKRRGGEEEAGERVSGNREEVGRAE
jgi:tetrahydromethanopterin S-methyltransferase subunit H